MLSLFFDNDDAGSGIPTRAEVRAEDTWDLTPLYATPAEWTADFARLQEEYPVLAEFRGKVGESAAALLALLKCDERIAALRGGVVRPGEPRARVAAPEFAHADRRAFVVRHAGDPGD